MPMLLPKTAVRFCVGFLHWKQLTREWREALYTHTVTMDGNFTFLCLSLFFS